MKQPKKTISSVFIGLVVFFTIPSVWGNITNVFGVLHGDYGFAIVNYLMNLLGSLVPLTLWIILFLTRSGRDKKFVVPLLITLGCIFLLFAVAKLIFVWIYITNILTSIFLLISAFYIQKKKNNLLMTVLTAVGCVLMLVRWFANIVESGNNDVQALINIFWFIGLCTFPRTVYDRKNCADDFDTFNVFILVLCIIIIIGVIGRMPAGSDHYSYDSNKSYSDNSNWGNYDYDSDGDINQNEWEDALGDYMDSVMP